MFTYFIINFNGLLSMKLTVLFIFIGFITLKSSATEVVVATCRTPSVLEYYPNATACQDKESTAFCTSMFPRGTTVPYQRNILCRDPAVFEIAIRCANTCFICCIVPEFDCENDPLSPIDCTLNANKCKDPSWSDVMSTYCPGTCGTCLSESNRCRDINAGCRDNIALCNDITFGTYMRQNCARTCNSCFSSSTCTDTANNCALNIALCNNPSNIALMTNKCAKTCGRCSSPPSVTPGISASTCTDTANNCALNIAFCNSPSHIDLMTKKCARTCGRCTTCSDTAINCAQLRAFCNNPIYLTLMTQKCARTCNFCSSSFNGAALPPATACSDTNRNCAAWIRNGFCSNSFYTQIQKRQYCGRSCNLC